MISKKNLEHQKSIKKESIIPENKNSIFILKLNSKEKGFNYHLQEKLPIESLEKIKALIK